MKIKGIAFSGERVYPENYHKLRPLLYYHLARYSFAKTFISRTDRVVDVACGTGYGTYELASLADTVIGIDISSEAIEYASKHFNAGNISFILGDASRLRDFIPGTADAIVSFETIEHLTREQQTSFLDSARLILEHDGVLIISTPNTLVYSGNKVTENPYHHCELTPTEFEEALKAHFSVVLVFGQRKFQGSTVKGLLFFLGSTLLNICKFRFGDICLNGDVAQQLADFEFSKYEIEKCPYLIAVCKKPIK